MNGGGNAGNDKWQCRQKTKTCNGGKVGNEQWRWRHKATKGSLGEAGAVCFSKRETQCL